MSPIPSAATATATFPAAASGAPDLGTAGQPVSSTSNYLIGTGGLLFVAVAIVSVAGYFFHRRGTGSSARTSDALGTLTGLFSHARHQGTTTNSTAVAVDQPVLPVHPDHVSMVYARFFHPTFWNPVECHLPTPSTPAICVEGEARAPVPGPRPYGTDSFLSMDDDDRGSIGARNDRTPYSRQKVDQDLQPEVKRLPPYDTSAPNINFSSEVIGTTVRPGSFLSVRPIRIGKPMKGPDVDGSEEDCKHRSCDGSTEMRPTAPLYSNRRHGVADMGSLAQRFGGTFQEAVHHLAPHDDVISGDDDLQVSPNDEILPEETHEGEDTISKLFTECFDLVADTSKAPNCDIPLPQGPDRLHSPSGAELDGPPVNNMDLMRSILESLRDSASQDCDARSLSGDTDFDLDNSDDEQSILPYLRPPRRCQSRSSMDSSFSDSGRSDDSSDEGCTYPSTPPTESSYPRVEINHTANDGVSPLSQSNTWRHGMLDFKFLARNVEDMVPPQGKDKVAISSQLDISTLAEKHPISTANVDSPDPTDEAPPTSHSGFNNSARDGHSDVEIDLTDVPLGTLDDCLDLVDRYLVELRGSHLDRDAQSVPTSSSRL